MATEGQIRWVVTEAAHAELVEVRELRGEAGYWLDVHDLRELLAGYFYATPGCNAKLGKTISPIGATGAGGKVLKIRWGYPGCGKSGGLRLCVAAFCEQRLVVLCHASMRRDVEESILIGSADDADSYLDTDDDTER